jgi:hypothetical protein
VQVAPWCDWGRGRVLRGFSACRLRLLRTASAFGLAPLHPLTLRDVYIRFPQKKITMKNTMKITMKNNLLTFFFSLFATLLLSQDILLMQEFVPIKKY